MKIGPKYLRPSVDSLPRFARRGPTDHFSHPSPGKMHALKGHIIESVYKNPHPGRKVAVDERALSDLEVFQPHEEPDRPGFFETLDFSTTMYGHIILKEMAKQPLAEPQEIKERTASVQELQAMPEETINQLEEMLGKIEKKSKNYQHSIYYANRFFNFGETKRGARIGNLLINSAMIFGGALGAVVSMLLSPTGLISTTPIWGGFVGVLLGLFWLFLHHSSHQEFFRNPFAEEYERGVLPYTETIFGQTIANIETIMDIMRHAQKIEGNLQAAGTSLLVDMREKINSLLNDPVLVGFVENMGKYYRERTRKEYPEYSDGPPKKVTYYEYKGPTYMTRYLSFQIEPCLEKAKELLNIFGQLDSLLAQAKANIYYGLNEGTPIDNPNAAIEVEGFFPPQLLNKEGVVTNAFSIDGETKVVPLTGPVYSGKSAVSRGLPLAFIWMGQNAYGIPGNFARFPIFNSVISNIYDADSILKGESGFTSHAKSIQTHVIEGIQANDNAGLNTFLFIDEPNRIMNPLETCAITLALIQEKLCKAKNLTAFIATHFAFIPKWLQAKSFPGIQNLQMHAYEKNEKPVYTYIIKPGISDAKLAIPTLQELGYDNAFIATARRTLAEISEKEVFS